MLQIYNDHRDWPMDHLNCYGVTSNGCTLTIIKHNFMRVKKDNCSCRVSAINHGWIEEPIQVRGADKPGRVVQVQLLDGRICPSDGWHLERDETVNSREYDFEDNHFCKRETTEIQAITHVGKL